MATVKQFILDNTTIDVEDSTARSNVEALQSTVTTLSTDVAKIKELSRLTVSYAEATSTIEFKTEVH